MIKGGWYYDSFADETSITVLSARQILGTPSTSQLRTQVRPAQVFSPVPSQRKRKLNVFQDTQDSQASTLPSTPTDEECLQIHSKKKIEELRSWLRNQMAVERGTKTLILTGPCGSGKTTSCKVLCDELGIEVMEFNGSQEFQVSYGGEEIHEKTMLQMFYQFIGDAECSSIEKMSLKQRLLLIKQLPSIFYRDQEVFRETIKNVTRCSRCIIVFVLSDIESSWELNPSRLFSPVLIDELRLRHVKFNPVTATQMSKVIRSTLNVMEVKAAKADVVKEIVSLADGDIRKALNTIEFFVNGRDRSSNKLPSTSGHFQLFHFIGKIMYAKRALNVDDGWTDTENKLVPKLQKLKRSHPPKDDLNSLISSSFVSGAFLTGYVFEHEPHFSGSMASLAAVESNLCAFDACTLGFSDSSNISDKYVLEVAVRSTIFHNYEAATPRKLYQFGKPKYKAIIAWRKETEELTRSIFPEQRTADANILTLPMLSFMDLKDESELRRSLIQRFSFTQNCDV